MYQRKRSLRSGCAWASTGPAVCSCSSAILFSIRRGASYCAPPAFVSSSCKARLKIKSTTKKNNPKRKTVTMTTEVVACTSFRVGATTLRISARTSLRKRVALVHKPITPPDIFASAPGSCSLLERCSPFSIAALLAILLILRAWRNCRADPVQNLAGAEGFEPPSSVLETDSLTVELTPLKTVHSLKFIVLSCIPIVRGLTARPGTSQLRTTNSELRTPPLLRFLVRLVLAATVTKLRELETARGRLLVFRRRVVPLLAYRALQRNDFPHKEA